jgi:hypothetical protein
VDDAWPEDSIDEPDPGVPVKKSMDKCSGPVSRGRVHNESCRLVNHDDILVFIDDAKFHGFGFQVQGLDLLDGHLDPRSLGQLNGRFGSLAGRKADPALTDELVRVTPCQPQASPDKDIKPGSRFSRVDKKYLAGFCPGPVGGNFFGG